jgi:hypothetical protein
MNSQPGYFSKIDSIHAHVEGGGASGLVEDIVKQLADQGSAGRITPISDKCRTIHINS